MDGLHMLAVAMTISMLLPCYHALWGPRRGLLDRAAAVIALILAAAVWASERSW